MSLISLFQPHIFCNCLCAQVLFCQIMSRSLCKDLYLYTNMLYPICMFFINANLQSLLICELDSVTCATFSSSFGGAGAATALLMTTIAPQDTFPAQHCESGNCYNNAAAWCIFSTMEHSYLARLTGGCRILLANVMGQVAMVIVALLINNLDADPAEGYPQRWL